MAQEQINIEDRLYRIFANVNDWLKFAEAKNLGLLTLNLALIVGLVQFFSSQDCTVHISVFIFSFSSLSISFLLALLSLSPLIGKLQKSQFFNTSITKFSDLVDKEVAIINIHFYGYLRTLDVNSFENIFLTKLGLTDINFNDYEKDLSNQIIYNSIIAYFKYQLFKIGLAISFLGIFLSLIIALFIYIKS